MNPRPITWLLSDARSHVWRNLSLLLKPIDVLRAVDLPAALERANRKSRNTDVHH
jgi:hypothetical protein